MKSKLRWVRLFSLWLVVGAAAGAMQCTAQTGSESQQAPGTLRLPLVTPKQGTYRLHHAVFSVSTQSGVPAVSLDSDAADPNATALTSPLAPGAYTVQLDDGWQMSHLEDDGSEASVQAALITANPQSFQIASSTETDLTFRFTTDAGVIVISNGTVGITIDVAPNSNLPPCDLSSSFSCPSGQTCLLAGSDGQTFCASPGSLPVRSPCSSEQCVAGSQCLRQDPEHPDQGTCLQFCNPMFPPFGCNCVSLGLSNPGIGICAAPPPDTCDLLSQSDCPEGEACQYRGGSFGTCGVPGTTPPGGFCTSETCVAGSQCFQNTCRPFCDIRLPPPPQCFFCENVGTGNAGRCFF